ncbi:hypothetical protein [Deinococcus aquaedulcis]|uniref:hypothetical protein n=1 Tax=Deinococcus aquaedulcis TaxID=2840455 RepID=UPI001C82E582|nr:hypothetical protein [Deinococcus aquaedulcis]
MTDHEAPLLFRAQVRAEVARASARLRQEQQDALAHALESGYLEALTSEAELQVVYRWALTLRVGPARLQA